MLCFKRHIAPYRGGKMMIGRQEHEESEYQGLRIRAAANLHRECFSIIEELNLPKGLWFLILEPEKGHFPSD